MRAMVLVGLTAGTLAAFPAPKGPGGPTAWKPTAGTKFVMTMRQPPRADAPGRDFERVVTNVTTADGEYSFTLTTTGTTAASRFWVGPTTTTQGNPDLVKLREVGYLRPGLKVGDRYVAPGLLAAPDEVFPHVVVAREEVSVPAGTFRALRIRATGKADEHTYWLSYEVGLVRIDRKDGTRYMELKSYTPGT